MSAAEFWLVALCIYVALVVTVAAVALLMELPRVEDLLARLLPEDGDR